MALTEGQQKLCRCYHYDLVVEPHHLWPIACSLQIHAAPMFHNFQTDKGFTVKNVHFFTSSEVKLHPLKG